VGLHVQVQSMNLEKKRLIGCTSDSLRLHSCPPSQTSPSLTLQQNPMKLTRFTSSQVFSFSSSFSSFFSTRRTRKSLLKQKREVERALAALESSEDESGSGGGEGDNDDDDEDEDTERETGRGKYVRGGGERPKGTTASSYAAGRKGGRRSPVPV
jgi:hypothetical protein